MLHLFVKYKQKLDEQKVLKVKLNSAFEAYQKFPSSKNSRTLIEAILKLDENVEFLTEHEKEDS